MMKRLLAAFSFFTRLPFWRLAPLEARHYENIVPLWPCAGLLTGGLMAAVYLLTSLLLPVPQAIVAALISRVLLTGGLHEDGFADFCDGFGGGRDREGTLKIMKDSHIGTYGVLGLILYYLLLYNVLTHIATALLPWQMACVILSADIYSKLMSSMIVHFLPYARKVEESKSRLVYAHSKTPYITILLSIVTFNAPLLFLLFRWMRRRIGGYTGDCCGATFIIMELFNYIIISICIAHVYCLGN